MASTQDASQSLEHEGTLGSGCLGVSSTVGIHSGCVTPGHEQLLWQMVAGPQPQPHPFQTHILCGMAVPI